MDSSEMKEIIITSAVASAAATLASSIITYMISRAAAEEMTTQVRDELRAIPSIKDATQPMVPPDSGSTLAGWIY